MANLTVAKTLHCGIRSQQYNNPPRFPGKLTGCAEHRSVGITIIMYTRRAPLSVDAYNYKLGPVFTVFGVRAGAAEWTAAPLTNQIRSRAVKNNKLWFKHSFWFK